MFSSTLSVHAGKIISRLQTCGFKAYYTGGAVRDGILGIEPKDFDIATDATPEQISVLFPRTEPIGQHFGVILVKNGGFGFEVATFRCDGIYKDGRRPETVKFSSPQLDAERRDFTINGLFYDPLTDEVIDFVGGKEDLERGIIRAIGDPQHRFQEDALRLLRAVRFSVKTGFAIEKQTLEALKRCAPLLKNVSIERIQEEFSKILSQARRAYGLQLLVDTGLIQFIVPEVLALIGCEQPPEFHPEGDVYQHTKLALSLLPPDAPLTLCLAVLLHDIGKPSTFSFDLEAQRIRFNKHDQVGAEMSALILHRLRYSNSVCEAVVSMVRHHMHFMHVQQMRTAKVRRFLARDTIQLELELHRVDCLSSNGLLDNYEFLLKKQEEFMHEPIIPSPFITGRDLIKLKIAPGPQFKEILSAVQTLQLEGDLASREEALVHLHKHYKP